MGKLILNLVKHIRLDHHNSKSYNCENCPRKFDTEDRLKAHVKKIHTDELNYQCDKCEKRFKNPSNLHTHLKYTHGTKTIQCDKCEYSCKNISKLKRHQTRVHSSNQIICDKCGKTFTNTLSLKDHKCMTCSQKSKTSKRLSKKPICQYCGAKFHGQRDRVVHEKSVHLNIRDLMCDECDYRTANAYKLRCHKEAIHEGIVYKCDVPGCGRSYRTKGSLYCHQDKNHDIPKPKTIEKMKKQLKNRENTTQGDTRVNDQ